MELLKSIKLKHYVSSADSLVKILKSGFILNKNDIKNGNKAAEILKKCEDFAALYSWFNNLFPLEIKGNYNNKSYYHIYLHAADSMFYYLKITGKDKIVEENPIIFDIEIPLEFIASEIEAIKKCVRKAADIEPSSRKKEYLANKDNIFDKNSIISFSGKEVPVVLFALPIPIKFIKKVYFFNKDNFDKYKEICNSSGLSAELYEKKNIKFDAENELKNISEIKNIMGINKKEFGGGEMRMTSAGILIFLLIIIIIITVDFVFKSGRPPPIFIIKY